MTIQYDDQYRFKKTDDLNWTLEERRKVEKGNNKGKDYWKTVSHHPTMGMLCRCLAHMLADEAEARSLIQYSAELEAIGNTIESRINKVLSHTEVSDGLGSK